MSDVRALMTIGWRCSASQPALAYRMPLFRNLARAVQEARNALETARG
jgi:hypothetical protein